MVVDDKHRLLVGSLRLTDDRQNVCYVKVFLSIFYRIYFKIICFISAV